MLVITAEETTFEAYLSCVIRLCATKILGE